MTAQILLHPSLAPLDGGINFRDFGGNGVADGRRIKRGLLFRSGSLERLTENDCTFLAGVPVRSVLDYRDADEVQAKPDILWSGADYHHVPANPLSSEVNANWRSSPTRRWPPSTPGRSCWSCIAACRSVMRPISGWRSC